MSSGFRYSKGATAAAKSLQSCPTLWDPIDGSPPGSPIPGILQARTLEWVAISFSNAWKWKWSHSVVSDLVTPWTAAHQAPPPILKVGILILSSWHLNEFDVVITEYLEASLNKPCSVKPLLLWCIWFHSWFLSFFISLLHFPGFLSRSHLPLSIA